jgi:hypothetical protein
MKNISTLKHGDHACFYFKDRQEQMHVTIPFIITGLERNERCLYLADPITLSLVKEELEDKGINVEKESARGALKLSSDRDYLVGGQFETAHMIASLRAAIKDALKAGFAGLRATGDMVWEMGPNLNFNLINDYESALDRFFHAKKFIGLCQYRQDTFGPKWLRNGLYTHPLVVLDGGVCPSNPFYNRQLPLEESDKKHRFVPLPQMFAALKTA